MPIKSHTNASKELTTLTATDGITFEEIMEVVKGFNDDPPTRNILWDFREAYPADPFDAADMDRIATLAKSNLASRAHSNGKTAFVATSDFVFGVTRMYTTYLELQEPTHEIQVFRTLDEAHKWLTQE